MDSAEYHRRAIEHAREQEASDRARKWQLERFYDLMEEANGRGWRERNGVPKDGPALRFVKWLFGG